MPKTERLKRSNVIILNGNIKINTKGICQQSSKWWSPSKEKWRGRSFRLPFFLNLATLVGLFTKILKNDHWAVRPRVCGVRLFHEILPIKDCHFKLWLLYIVLLKEAKLRGSPTYKRENKEKGIHTVEAEDPPGQIPHPSLHCPGRALQRLCKMAFWGPQGNAELRKGGHILRKWMPHRWPVSVSCTPFFHTWNLPLSVGSATPSVPSLMAQGRASPSVTFFLILLLSHQLVLQFFLSHTTQVVCLTQFGPSL